MGEALPFYEQRRVVVLNTVYPLEYHMTVRHKRHMECHTIQIKHCYFYAIFWRGVGAGEEIIVGVGGTSYTTVLCSYDLVFVYLQHSMQATGVSISRNEPPAIPPIAPKRPPM